MNFLNHWLGRSSSHDELYSPGTMLRFTIIHYCCVLANDLEMISRERFGKGLIDFGQSYDLSSLGPTFGV